MRPVVAGTRWLNPLAMMESTLSCEEPCAVKISYRWPVDT